MPEKNKSNRHHLTSGRFIFSHTTDREQRRRELLGKAGAFLENSIDAHLNSSPLAVPVLDPATYTGVPSIPQTGHWFRVPLSKGMSGDGSEYHIYVKRGASQNTCIFLSGGGVAWNEYTAAHPSSMETAAAAAPGFYWNNLRPVTQMMNIGVGITEASSQRNPFRDWNFAVITYATGDFHIGNGSLDYKAEDGSREILHFHGYQNFHAAMMAAVRFFPEPERLLIAGDSAGAFAVPALAGEIADQYYSSCEDITLLSDSALLKFNKWRRTVKDIWGSPEKFWLPVTSDNIVTDWYRNLAMQHPGRFRCLFAGSTHDFLLSAYYNDVAHETFRTDAEVQDTYYRQFCDEIRELQKIDPSMRFYIYDWKNILRSGSGTIHTAVRQPYFYHHRKNGTSMAAWLEDAVSGNVYDVGMSLLSESGT